MALLLQREEKSFPCSKFEVGGTPCLFMGRAGFMKCTPATDSVKRVEDQRTLNVYDYLREGGQ